MIKLYGVPTCKKIRNTKQLLDEHGIEYQFVNVKKTPLSEAQLNNVRQQLGLDRILNRKGPTYRKLGLKDKILDENSLFQYLRREQNMINRPLLEKDGQFWAGYDEKGILEFVKG